MLTTVLATLQSNDQGTGGGWTGVKLMNGQVPWNASPPHDGSLSSQCQPTGYAIESHDTAEPLLKKAFLLPLNKDWWVCMPLPFCPKMGLGMKVP